MAKFQPGNQFGKSRAPHKDKYIAPVTAAEMKLVGRLPEIVDRLIATALGETKQYLMNHKTGAVEEVPVDPATQLKAQVYVMDRLGGKPETTKVHEVGPELQAGFTVLLGEAALGHWQHLNAPKIIELTETVEDELDAAIAEALVVE